MLSRRAIRPIRGTLSVTALAKELGFAHVIVPEKNGAEALAVKGIAVSVQGRRDAQMAMIAERTDGRGNPYYWISFTPGNSTPGHGTDLEALAQNKISVTPLKLDLTDVPALTRLAVVLR